MEYCVRTWDHNVQTTNWLIITSLSLDATVRANSLKEPFACLASYSSAQDEGADFMFLCVFAASHKFMSLSIF